MTAPAMTLLLFNLFGTILMMAVAPRRPGALSERLARLRDWPSERNRPRRQ
jgi:hypothetical protein